MILKISESDLMKFQSTVVMQLDLKSDYIATHAILN